MAPRMRALLVVGPLLLVVAAAATGAAAQAISSEPEGELCFNQLQVLGTHNSYHQAPPPELLQALGLAAGPLRAWQYTHLPLTAQLDAGVRALELDVYWDPQGGTYGQSAGLRIANQNGWLMDPKYQQPGFKVLHVPDFDFGTSCILLADCLAEIRQWSDAHPRHLPIQLHIEVKEGGQVQESLGALLTGLLLNMLSGSTAEGPSSLVEVPQSTAQVFLDLQAELAAAFGGSTADGGVLLTPDDVRAALDAPEGADLQELLMAASGSGPCPWPSLDSMRGKVMVKLIQYGDSNLASLLQQAYPDLKGSLAWVEQGGRRSVAQAVFRGTATWRLQDDSTALSLGLPANASGLVGDMAAAVTSTLEQGFVVRSRADADTVEAREEFTGRRDALLAAGAHVLATDYIEAFIAPGVAGQVALSSDSTASSGSITTSSDSNPSASASQTLLFETTYKVSLPGGQAGRCLNSGSGSGNAASGAAAVRAFDAVDATGSGEGGDGDGVFCGPLVFAADGTIEGAGGRSVVESPEVADGPDTPAASNGDGSSSDPPPQVGQPSNGGTGRHTLPVLCWMGTAAVCFMLQH